jgi:osmotically-inducible protein OsmY
MRIGACGIRRRMPALLSMRVRRPANRGTRWAKKVSLSALLHGLDGRDAASSWSWSRMEHKDMKTDAALQLDVIAELKWEPSVNAANVGVEVKDGVVTLAGHVNTYAEKWDAERAAQRVVGVKAIAVEMDVRLSGSDIRSDADIARSASNVLEWATSVPKDSVQVKVEGGWITLSGEVAWEYQRQSAADSVRYLMGVTGISDQILITPQASSDAVRSDIEAALKRRVRNDSRRISVSVVGHEVTLAGSVQSWSDKDLANHSAWGTPGVRNVIDKMTVVY